MQARYQDPIIGRFLSVDPVTFMSTGDPRYFNRYAYGFNDPINLIDPSGENPCNALDCDAIKETLSDAAESIGRGINAALQDPASFEQGVGKGIQNAGADVINRAVTLGEAASPNLTVGQLPDVPNAAPASNQAEQFGMTVGETGTVGAMAVAAPGAPTAARTVGTGVASAVKTAGNKLFGRGGQGVLNSNSKLRVGYGWKGSRENGKAVFRVSVGSGKKTKHYDLFDLN